MSNQPKSKTFLQVSIGILALCWAFSLTAHAVINSADAIYCWIHPEARFQSTEALCTTDSECAEFFPGTNGDPQ